MRRLRVIVLFSVAVAMIAYAAGCGDGNGISREDLSSVELEMSMDDVEAILGQPERSHVTGSNDNPSIFWYYTKADGDGLVKISFESGKVTTVAPYDQSFEVGE